MDDLQEALLNYFNVTLRDSLRYRDVFTITHVPKNKFFILSPVLEADLYQILIDNGTLLNEITSQIKSSIINRIPNIKDVKLSIDNIYIFIDYSYTENNHLDYSLKTIPEMGIYAKIASKL